MSKYFTNIAKNEIQSDWVQRPLTHALTSFTSFQDFGKELINIIVLPCKFLLLTIATAVEALVCLISFLYCYFCGFRDFVDRHTRDGWECASVVLKTLGLLLSSLLYSLVFCLRLISTFFQIGSNTNNRYITISDAATSYSSLTRDNAKLLSSAKRRYGEYMSETSDDIEVICKTLGENSRELSVHDEKISIFCTKANHSKMSIKGITHFQQEDHTNSKPRSSRYCELLSVFRELAATYPKAEFEDWEAVEERRKITIVMVEEAHTNFEAHHMKLLDVAVELMTESGIDLQRARNIIRKIDDLDKQATIGVNYV